ncbi:MAG: C39 family peptidase [Candidatus Aenigmarchaeota archaeon]|nr:C39 family peptidase [Candidatus Aenigmarchaeota archaeon]
MKMQVPVFRQGRKACGPAALRMVLAYYGERVTEKAIINAIGGVKSYGARTIALAEFARKMGFKTECLSYNKKMAKGMAKIRKPSKADILKHLRKNIPDFIVITGYKDGYFFYNDPDDGKRKRIKENDLLFAWHSNVLDSSAYLLAAWK